MSDATSEAVRVMVVSKAAAVCGQDGVAYGNVDYKGRRYAIQYSRPRHPSALGRVLSTGVAVHYDEGHDDNRDLRSALGPAVDFSEIVAHMAEASGADVALAESLP